MRFLDCVKCKKNSQQKNFKLCLDCSQEIEELKQPVKEIETIVRKGFKFTIGIRQNKIVVDLSCTDRTSYVIMGDSITSAAFQDVEQAKEAIDSWCYSL